MNTATITLYVRNREVEVEAEGIVKTGGSNSYGSDEPAWAEVDNVTLRNGRGEAVSKRFMDALTAEDWDHIETALIEG